MLRNPRGLIFLALFPLVFIVGMGVLFTGLAIKAEHCDRITGRHHAAIDESLKDCKP